MEVQKEDSCCVTNEHITVRRHCLVRYQLCDYVESQFSTECWQVTSLTLLRSKPFSWVLFREEKPSMLRHQLNKMSQ
jgi:hypothetical protein